MLGLLLRSVDREVAVLVQRVRGLIDRVDREDRRVGAPFYRVGISSG